MAEWALSMSFKGLSSQAATCIISDPKGLIVAFLDLIAL